MGFVAALLVLGALFQENTPAGPEPTAISQSATAQAQNTPPQNPPSSGAVPPAQTSDPAKPDKPLSVNAGSPIIKSPPSAVNIPFITRPPKMEEFETMTPSRADMVKVTGFIQQYPTDGAQPTQQTE